MRRRSSNPAVAEPDLSSSGTIGKGWNVLPSILLVGFFSFSSPHLTFSSRLTALHTSPLTCRSMCLDQESRMIEGGQEFQSTTELGSFIPRSCKNLPFPFFFDKIQRRQVRSITFWQLLKCACFVCNTARFLHRAKDCEQKGFCLPARRVRPPLHQGPL